MDKYKIGDHVIIIKRRSWASIVYHGRKAVVTGDSASRFSSYTIMLDDGKSRSVCEDELQLDISKIIQEILDES